MTDETDAAAVADQLDPTDPDRAADDSSDGAVDQDSHRGDPIGPDDDQEVLIDAVIAGDEPDPQPDATP